MKKIVQISILVLFFTGCTTTLRSRLKLYDSEIEFSENSVDYYDNGTLKKCRLSKDTKINGYVCQWWIHFFHNGQINQFRTAVDIPVNEYIIPAHSTVFLHPDQPSYIKQVWLAKDTKIQGIDCSGKGKISTSFHPNGALKSCSIDRSTIIQGYPCKGGIFKNIQFDPEGKLKSFTLSKDITYKNTTIPSGSRIIINPDKTLHIIED